MKSVNILGVNIMSSTMELVLETILDVLNSDFHESKHVCATSVHGVIESQSDLHLRTILNKAFITHPDGKPLAWAGRLLGAKDMEQIKGPDFILKVCEVTAQMNVKHFFYGGNTGVAEELANTLSDRYPGFKVAGFYSPPFKPLDENEKKYIITLINDSHADIVWVGLSTPKQEKWIYEFAPLLNVKLLFSVGAAFDFHTGRIKIAPAWMQWIGMEWFFRLLSEPNRLWRRYTKIVPLFIIYFLLQYTGLKRYSINDSDN